MKTSKWKAVLAGAGQGFTLLEVLIAMAIFSIGILAVGALILTTTRNNTDSNIITQATMLARSKIEEKKREAQAGALSIGDETESNIDNQGNAGGIYTRVCSVAAFGSGDSREIQVTVSWTRNGRNRSVVLTTLNKGS